jgi:hypothetical protein
MTNRRSFLAGLIAACVAPITAWLPRPLGLYQGTGTYTKVGNQVFIEADIVPFASGGRLGLFRTGTLIRDENGGLAQVVYDATASPEGDPFAGEDFDEEPDDELTDDDIVPLVLKP